MLSHELRVVIEAAVRVAMASVLKYLDTVCNVMSQNILISESGRCQAAPTRVFVRLRGSVVAPRACY